MRSSGGPDHRPAPWQSRRRFTLLPFFCAGATTACGYSASRLNATSHIFWLKRVAGAMANNDDSQPRKAEQPAFGWRQVLYAFLSPEGLVAIPITATTVLVCCIWVRREAIFSAPGRSADAACRSADAVCRIVDDIVEPGGAWNTALTNVGEAAKAISDAFNTGNEGARTAAGEGTGSGAGDAGNERSAMRTSPTESTSFVLASAIAVAVPLGLSFLYKLAKVLPK